MRTAVSSLLQEDISRQRIYALQELCYESH